MNATKARLLSGLLLGLFVIMGLSSCGQTPDFNSEDPVFSLFADRHKVLSAVDSVSMEEQPLRLVSAIEKYKDWLIIRAGSDESQLLFYNVNTGETIKGLPKGRGPNEVMLVSGIQIVGDTLWLFAPNERKHSMIDLKNSVLKRSFVYGDSTRRTTSWTIKSCIVPGGIVSMNMQARQRHWYAYVDKNGERQSVIDVCDFKEISDYTDRQKMSLHATSSFLGVGPDGKRIVSGGASFGALSFSKFDHGQLLELKRYLFYPPASKAVSEYQVAFSREARTSFCGACITENYVYLLYSGKTDAESVEIPAWECNHFLVMTPDGDPVRHYVLDINISAFYVDEDARILWGYSSEPTKKLVKYSLPKTF
jgi:hypothetical protein